MSKKSLLNESQVRQFMKLAKLEPLSPGFVEGLKENYGSMPGRDEDEELDEAVEDDREMEVDPAEMEDVVIGDEEADLEMDAELEAPVDADVGGQMIDATAFFASLKTSLEAAIGQPVDIDADDMADEDAELEAPVDDELAGEAGDPLDGPAPDGDEMGVDDALMEAVTKRVAKRILMEALSTKK